MTRQEFKETIEWLTSGYIESTGDKDVHLEVGYENGKAFASEL